jgi:hypothetical protein
LGGLARAGEEGGEKGEFPRGGRKGGASQEVRKRRENPLGKTLKDIHRGFSREEGDLLGGGGAERIRKIGAERATYISLEFFLLQREQFQSIT